MGEEASVEEIMLARPVPLPGGRATFSVRANEGVETAWCLEGQPLDSTTRDGWLRLEMPTERWSEAVLWLANVDAEQVGAEIQRPYPGSPLPS